MAVASDFNRSLSKVFSNAIFKEIAQTGMNSYFFGKLKKYDNVLSVEPGMKVKDVLENAYGYLGKNYRNEYLYKNTIINKVLLGRHSLRTATMLNEFKVAGSIADSVIINGTSTVYEIKTELDTADKLNKQLEDYRKAFAKIYLVTHHSLVNKYLSLLNDTNIGLLALSGRFNLSLIKEAEEDYSGLSIEVMMKCLRKEEYSAIIKRYTGAMPNVSNIRYFTECLKMAQQMKPIEFHSLMLEQLRRRQPINIENLESKSLPKELKHICFCINPSKKEYDNILHFLDQNL